MTRLGYTILIGIMVLVVIGAWLWPTNFTTNSPLSTTTAPAFYDDLIMVDTPLPGATVVSPLTVSGRARGVWYFEASFPVKLYDGNGTLLIAIPATAEGEWMTNEYVPFSATLTFAAPLTATGTLVFEKDNPSGLPEHARELRILVRFAATTTPSTSAIPIKLYYYNPTLDQGQGGSLCSSKGLVAVDRTIPKTMTPLRDTIELLLRGKLTDAERARGITTEFPLPGLGLEHATISNGIATLTFGDLQHKTGGGSCRVAVLRAQIEATAKQFPSVASVEFLPATLFQP